MADYIDREALLDRIEELQNVFGYGKTEHENGFYMGLNRALAEVDNFPAADVVPVVRGQWKDKGMVCGERYFQCSACGGEMRVPTLLDEPMYTYCPNCGERMDGEA